MSNLIRDAVANRVLTQKLAGDEGIGIGDVVYHGSPRGNIKKIIPKNMHGDPDVSKVVFASPHRKFALPYAGKKWGDADIEQGVLNNKIYLREMRPGALKDIFDTSGSMYTLPDQPFRQYRDLKDRGGSWRWEVMSNKPVTPLSKEKIDNILHELKNEGVALHTYDPDSPGTNMAIKRTAQRAMNMTPEKREGYIQWWTKKSPVEITSKLLSAMDTIRKRVYPIESDAADIT